MDKKQEGIVGAIRKAQKGNSQDICKLLEIIEELDSECDDANATIDRLRSSSFSEFRKQIRDTLANHHIVSNPGWSDQQIISALQRLLKDTKGD